MNLQEINGYTFGIEYVLWHIDRVKYSGERYWNIMKI